jgi:hypothetical protein
MYDRWTESYWSQGLGLAVTGELTGMQLKTIPFDVITWGDWKKLHPDTLVLTTDTGHLRSYATDPYGDYYTDPRIIFPIDNQDDRMHPKEIILGFNEDGIYKAYKQNDVELHKVINDDIGETPLMLVSLFSQNSRAFDRNLNGEVLEFEFIDEKIIDTKTKSEWNCQLSLAFGLNGLLFIQKLRCGDSETNSKIYTSWDAYDCDLFDRSSCHYSCIRST